MTGRGEDVPAGLLGLDCTTAVKRRFAVGSGDVTCLTHLQLNCIYIK